MSEQLRATRGRAVELLELRDDLDVLDEELRVGKTAFRLTAVVSTVLAAPLLAVLWMNHVRFFAAYPSTFLIVLVAILYAMTVERRRLEEKREAIRNRIRLIEEAAPQVIGGFAPGSPLPFAR